MSVVPPSKVHIGAHMFRQGKELTHLGDRRLRRLSALELNGKDFFNDAAVRVEAARLHLLVVGGSDAHFWWHVGIKATVLSIDRVTRPAVAAALARGQSDVYRMASGPVVVRASKLYKQVHKAHQRRAA